jgi:deaminated glutathione amidase
MSRVRAACVQVNAGNDSAANLDAAEALIEAAAGAGARLIALPENVALMAPPGAGLDRFGPEEGHPALDRLARAARRTGAWILIGSLGVRLDDGRAANRSFLIDAEGRIAARYDKIHLFDVDLPNGERYRESDTYRAGTSAVVAATPWGGLGLTVCYDVRFPALHRALAQAGAAILTVPAAFTAKTGEAHWHVLLRARAIETGCFVLAPAQTGPHPGGRRRAQQPITKVT